MELAQDGKGVPYAAKRHLPKHRSGSLFRWNERHAAYSDMLEHLTLLDRHGENLLERGLSEERIRANGYKSMPETERGRRLLG